MSKIKTGSMILTIGLAFAGLGILVLPESAWAKKCGDLGGTCVSIGTCKQEQYKDPAVQCLSADDCSAFSQQACAVVSQKKPGDNCNAQGGSCSDICKDQDENIGVLNCPKSSSQVQQTCCRAKINAPAAPAAGAAVSGAGGAAPSGGILPACAKTGDCTLDDIVQTGVNFATFLLGLSGALFLLIFIYGGTLYLASFGRSEYVEKGKKAIKGAAIGIIIVVSAWTLVRFIMTSLMPQGASAPASGQAKVCPAPSQCTTLLGDTAQAALADAEKKNLACQTGLCPGPVNVLCCKSK